MSDGASEIPNDDFGDFAMDLVGSAEEIVPIDEALMDSDDECLSQALDLINSVISEPEPGHDSPAHPDVFVATIINDQPLLDSKPRFKVMTDTEIDALAGSVQSKGTQKMTSWAVKQFKQWLASRNLSLDFEELAVSELDDLLRRFYAEVRTVDGEVYSRSSYGGLRAALNRHLRSPPYNRNIVLMSGEFHKSNAIFKASLKKLCQDGLDKTTHHSPISNGDLAKLRQSEALLAENPATLQRKVWFDLTIHFARRGCENINSLKKNAYVFKFDDTGREYVEMSYSEQTKNHQGIDKTVNLESKPRMHASTCETAWCPVKSLKTYLSKLHPENELLFQQARRRVKVDDAVWYTTRQVGSKTIGGFMAALSEEANLSQRYTNHCVRATTITMLSHSGVSNRAITRISKHRTETSLKHYEHDSSDAQKRQFSDILLQENTTHLGRDPNADNNTHSPNGLDFQTVDTPNSSVVPYTRDAVTASATGRNPLHPTNVNVLAYRQTPQLWNPYSFTQCNVTVNNQFFNQ